MKLFEHPDFEQASHPRGGAFPPAWPARGDHREGLLRHRGPAHHRAGGGRQVIFKGGTSLSKGWNLIQRFSEDIDIFLDPTAFDPPLGKKGIDRELKKLRQAIEQHPALTFVEKESQTIGGFGRNDRFEYAQRFAGAGEIRNRVFVEAGTASGREPTERVRLQSYVGQFLAGKRSHPRGRGRRPVRDAAASFPADLRREDVRDPRQGRGVQEGRPADRRLRPPLLRPVLPGRAAGSPGDAPLRRVRGHQGRLRPDQPSSISRRATCHRPT